jgi:Ribbon-helix-helix protein, copG family
VIRTQISLTPDQLRRLQSEARRRRISVAAVIREAVESSVPPDDREERIRRALAAIGSVSGDAHDVAERHDEYLGDALWEEYVTKRRAWAAERGHS